MAEIPEEVLAKIKVALRSSIRRMVQVMVETGLDVVEATDLIAEELNQILYEADET